MKKLFCVLLCVVLTFGILPMQTTAADTDSESYPVILMPGLLENTLIADKGEKSQKTIWFPLHKAVWAAVHHAPAIAWNLFFGSEESIGELTVRIIREVAGGIRLNADGSSYLPDVQPVVTKAAECSYDALKKSRSLVKVTYGKTMMKTIAAQIGGDRTFVFQYDWRMSPVGIADDLHAFIRDVKELTGSDKVNISGTSFGSEVLIAYLKKYGAEGDLHHVLMNSPAYGGSSIFKALMAASGPDVQIDYESILEMLFSNYGAELPLGVPLRIIPKGVVDIIFHESVTGFIMPDFLTSVSMWGCCPPEDYEEMKALLLDPVENAAMIAETDYVQHEIMAKRREILQGAAAYGTTVYVISNEGSKLITSRGSGDVLVDAAYGTGGVCLDIGTHFPDDYVPDRHVCTNEAHDHVSYTGSIDLTNADLPETTWVFYGQMHGQNYYDTKARALTVKLLTTDDIRTVHDDPAFPQFMETASAVSDVSVTWTDSRSCVLCPENGAVQATVQNLSQRHPMLVRKIVPDGIPYTVDCRPMLLLPGQSRTVTLTPTGKNTQKYGSLTIEYDELLNLELHKTRTQCFEVV